MTCYGKLPKSAFRKGFAVRTFTLAGDLRLANMNRIGQDHKLSVFFHQYAIETACNRNSRMRNKSDTIWDLYRFMFRLTLCLLLFNFLLVIASR